LTFVTGHPGNTSRSMTVTQLEYQRDTYLPEYLLYLAERRGYLTEFQNRGPEAKRIVGSDLASAENNLKSLRGRLFALTDKDFFKKKIEEEKQLRGKINGKPAWKKQFGGAWDDIARAQKDLKQIRFALTWKEHTRFDSTLFAYAKNLVRAAAELPKPNEKRYREFTEGALPQLKQRLFSTAPIYEELEIAEMTFELTKMREALTADDPFVRLVLGKKSPAELAKELIQSTKLKDVKVRQALFEGGQKAIEASSDLMIKLALAIDPEGRAIRAKYEDEIEPRFRQASEKIAQARFAVYGNKLYPDATFTLRISYGQVRGYEENGRKVTPLTTIGGAFERATGSEPFALPPSWIKEKKELNPQTPFNLCSDNDIIGGNSGSPVINKDAQIVGLIFDGNIQSLGGDYGYDGTQNRAVAVHSAVILEALQKVYKADRIVQDLKGSL
jgi:hypothetical protein